MLTGNGFGEKKGSNRMDRFTWPESCATSDKRVAAGVWPAVVLPMSAFPGGELESWFQVGLTRQGEALG